MEKDEKSLRKKQSCSKTGSVGTLMDRVKPAFSLAGKKRGENFTFLQEEMSTEKGVLAALRHNAGSGGAFGQDLTDAANLCAHAFQLLFNPLIAAIYVIDAVDDGFTIGNQRGDDQRG